MARLFTLPRVTPIVSGAVSPGAKANFFLTGTTTRTDTYTDDALGTPHANPVIADAAGVFAAIYLDPDIDYKLTLDDTNDALIYTEDPVIDTLTAENVGKIFYPRTSAEITVGVTPTNFQYDLDDPRRYGAVGDNSTDDLTAFTNMAKVITQRGGGRVDLQGLTYKITAPKATSNPTPVMTFTSCAGVQIINGTINDIQTYSQAAAESGKLAEFIACTEIVMRLKVTSEDLSSDYTFQSGLIVSRFTQGCHNVELDMDITGGLRGCLMSRGSADPVSHRSSGFRLNLRCQSLHYPLTGFHSGENVTGTLNCIDCGRNYFADGDCHNHEIKIISQDQKVASIINARSGLGCSNIKLTIEDRATTAGGVTNPWIHLRWSDSTAATHRNIYLHFNTINPASGNWDRTLEISKLNGGSADTTSRGHVLDGLKVSGFSHNAANDHIGMDTGAFAGSDVVRNIHIKDFICTGAKDINIPSELLGVLEGVSTVTNVSSARDLILENSTAGKVVYTSCQALNFTPTTNDDSVHVYVGCDITGATRQNWFTTKSFVECATPSGTAPYENRLTNLKIGQFHAEASARLIGDHTSATDMFRVWMDAGHAYFKLHYWVYDSHGANPATREEIAGIKSFSASMSSAGAWTAFLTVANQVAERTLNPGTAALTVTLSDNADADGDGDGIIQVTVSTFSGGTARGSYFLEMDSTDGGAWVKAA